MTTTKTETRAEEIARLAKAEILSDIREGIVPRGVVTFEALHEHVDANMYLKTDYDIEDTHEVLNEAIEIIQAWLPSANAPVEAAGWRCDKCGRVTVEMPKLSDKCKVCDGQKFSEVADLVLAAVADLKERFSEADQKRIAWWLEWNEEKEDWRK